MYNSSSIEEVLGKGDTHTQLHSNGTVLGHNPDTTQAFALSSLAEDVLAWLLGGLLLMSLFLLGLATCKLCLCLDKRWKSRQKLAEIEDTSIVMHPSPCFVELDSNKAVHDPQQFTNVASD